MTQRKRDDLRATKCIDNSTHVIAHFCDVSRGRSAKIPKSQSFALLSRSFQCVLGSFLTGRATSHAAQVRRSDWPMTFFDNPPSHGHDVSIFGAMRRNAISCLPGQTRNRISSHRAKNADVMSMRRWIVEKCHWPIRSPHLCGVRRRTPG
jgi:hypothetical protein